MIFVKSIADYLLSKIEGRSKHNQFINWYHLSKIVIIAFDNQLNDLSEFLKNCSTDKIAVNVMIILNGKEQKSQNYPFEHTILNNKQFNIWGFPKTDFMSKFNNHNIDLLINLGSENQIKSLALSKLMDANCKIGHFQNNVFDITIESELPLTNSEFLKQVIVYLKMIKRH